MKIIHNNRISLFNLAEYKSFVYVWGYKEWYRLFQGGTSFKVDFLLIRRTK